MAPAPIYPSCSIFKSDFPHMFSSVTGASDYNGLSSLASSIYSDSPTNVPSVASPDRRITMDGEPSTSLNRRMPSLSSLPAQLRRPKLELRSFSYNANYRASTNSVPRIPESTTGPPSPHPQHQWSLFGQLMENEGQLQTSGAVLAGLSRTPTSFDQPSQRASFVSSPIEESSNNVLATRISMHTQEPSAQDVYSGPEITSDEEVSSEGPDETATSATRVSRTAITHWISSRLPTIPLLWKNILKCSVSYFLGSLFTFHPPLSRFFGDLTSSGTPGGGPYPSAHLIATM